MSIREVRLQMACELVLLFHSGGDWSAAKRAEWERKLTELLGPKDIRNRPFGIPASNEATTRNLCDAVRKALKPGKPKKRRTEPCGDLKVYREDAD